MKSKKPVVRIAVLGSGFGAMQTLLRLHKLRKKVPTVKLHVTVFSRTDYFWLVTMAHEIATGNLMPADVKQPLRSLPITMFDDFIQSEVVSINTDERAVNYRLLETTQADESLLVQKRQQFDYIVSSLGSEVNFFGIPGAEEYALPVKTLADVVVIKNRILQSFEDAEQIDDVESITQLLSFLIVGGGATGVELAGELADLVNHDLTKRFPRVAKYASITIIQGGDKIGIPSVEWMTAELEEILQKKHCVKIMCNSFVSEVSPQGVMVGDQKVAGNTVIWSGGVKGSTVDWISKTELTSDKTGRLSVQRDLSLESNNKVFIIGDQALVMDKEGNPYPMRAQFAVRQGHLVAENIVYDLNKKPRHEFDYVDKGVIVGLGDGTALADIFGIRITGRPAHFIYRVVYLPQIIGLRAKVKTFVDWTLNLVAPRDLSKL